MKKKNTSTGRGSHRKVKSISFPKKLAEAIQKEADANFNGDFTRAVIAKYADSYKEAREFLTKNPTDKHNPKKT